MKTIKEIRRDLQEIRYYYSQISLFEKGAKYIFPEGILKKVKTYADIIKNAPARLYILYVSLYVNNNNQVTLAAEWGFSPEYIRDLNKLLCEYLQERIA